MTANWELFAEDPRGWSIPNEGVTQVGPPQDDRDWEVLQWELKSFVCDGEYAAGLERVLTQYLSHLTKPQQTAAWVSGFYGSGKSHLSRMLAELWVDRTLPSGDSARSLTDLSTGVKDALVELDGAGRRLGGRWAATGKLGSGVTDAYRLAFLSVLFRSAGLPDKYPAARFALSLKQEGVYDEVVDRLKAEGIDPSQAFLELYVNSHLHRAVLEHLPGYASDAKELRDLLRAQYPNVDDVSDDELKLVMTSVLESESTDGEIPHTVVVLDEIQQYVGDNNDRLDQVQNIAELVAASFDSRILVVATGQSALAGSPILSKIQHRFPTKVELSDKDVEQVTRKLALRKRPDAVSGLESSLDAVSGEISSHLTSAKIGFEPSDMADLPFDYPILPVRRRLWERLLRAIDTSGGSGQLRTQLRMSHEANQTVAEHDIPWVVGADYIYFDQSSGMLSGRVLSHEMHERILAFDDGTDEGKLQQRVLALIFMLSQLPRDAGADIEVRPNVDTLTQLLVTDLVEGSGPLRDRVRDAVAALAEDGVVVDIDGNFALQTPAGARLRQKFEQKKAALKANAPEMTHLRNEALKEAANSDLGGITRTHGQSRVQRKTTFVFGGDQPQPSVSAIPIWVQTEWAASSRSVEDAAREAGVSDPTVFVFLPRQDAAALDDALSRRKAADLVLAAEPPAQTTESQEARRALEADRDSARTEVALRVGEVLQRAVVRQGGGSEVTSGSSLRGNVEMAVDASLTRMFPRFSQGDHPDWPKVADRARQGNPNPLDVVGHVGDVQAHPVTAAIYGYVASPKTGATVRDDFKGGDYGWGQDTIDGGLLALVAAGLVEARDTQQKAVDASTINTRALASTTFAAIDKPVTQAQRLELRGLLSDFGIDVESSALHEGMGRMVERFGNMITRVVGPAPMPSTVAVPQLDSLRNATGNEAIHATLAAKDALKSEYEHLQRLDQIVDQRRDQWALLERLRAKAAHLDVESESASAVNSILENRRLLETPDPALPIVREYVSSLRDTIVERYSVLADALEQAQERVKSSESWNKADAQTRARVLDDCGLQLPTKPELGTPEAVLASLDVTPLSGWDNLVELTPARESSALAALARAVEPEVRVVSIRLPSRVLRSPEDVEAYLAEVKAILEGNLESGNHVSL